MRNYFLFVIFSSFLLTACDHVAEPKPPLSGGTTGSGGSTSGELRKVLLEDFTGHKCKNCPDAARTLYALQYQPPTNYGEKVVVVAIHAGSFATPSGGSKYNYDFRTAIGNTLNGTGGFAIQQYPGGLINRANYPTGQHAKPYSEWGTEIAKVIDQPADIRLTISNTYDPVNRNLTTDVKSKFLKNKTGTFNVAVYLTEDSIINWQLDGSTDIPNYVHRHVLRAAINGNGTPWGETLVAASAQANDSITKTYNYILPNNFIDKHCHIVAFVYDNDSNSPTYREVIQVEEEKMK